MTVRIHPPTPFFDSLVEKHGSMSVFEKFFDKNLDPLPDAPDELKREVELLRNGNLPSDAGSQTSS